MQLFTLTGRIATPDNVPVQGCVVRAFMLPTRVILEDTGIAQTVKTKTDAGGQFTLRLIKAEGVRYSIQTEAPERLPSGLVVDPWTLPGDTASLADLTTAAPGPLPPLQLGLTEDEKTRLQAIPPAVDSLDSRVTALEGDSAALTVVSTGPVDLDDAAPVGTMRGFVVTADGVLIEGTTTTAGTWVAVKEAAKNGDASGWVLYQAGAGGGATGTTDTTPPSAVTGLTVTSKTDSTVTLSWTAASDPETPVTYQLQVTPSGGTAGSWVTIATTGTGTLTGTVTGLTPGAYTIAVRPKSAGGTGSGQSVQVTLNAPYRTLAASISPFSYVPLGDAAGSTAAANEGSSGTVYGARGGVTFGAAGVGDRATSVEFDGTSGDLISPVGEAVALGGKGQFTISALVVLSSAAQVGRVIAAKNLTWTLAMNSLQGPYIGVEGGPTVGTSQPLTVGKRTHIAARADGTALSFWVDGVKVAEKPWTGSLTAYGFSATIGSENGSLPWAGRIGGLVLEDSALTDAQITQLAQAGLA